MEQDRASGIDEDDLRQGLRRQGEQLTGRAGRPGDQQAAPGQPVVSVPGIDRSGGLREGSGGGRELPGDGDEVDVVCPEQVQLSEGGEIICAGRLSGGPVDEELGVAAVLCEELKVFGGHVAGTLEEGAVREAGRPRLSGGGSGLGGSGTAKGAAEAVKNSGATAGHAGGVSASRHARNQMGRERLRSRGEKHPLPVKISPRDAAHFIPEISLRSIPLTSTP